MRFSEPSLRRAGWIAWAVTLFLVAVSVGLHIAAHRVHLGLGDIAGGLAFFCVGIGIATLGALIVSKQPRNPIGWMFVALSLLAIGLNDLVSASVTFASGSGSGSGFAAHAADWFANLTQGPSLFGAFLFIFLLFPNGRLLSPRWRPVAWIGTGALILLSISVAFEPGPMQSYPSVRNPFGITPLASILKAASNLGFLLLMLTLLAAAVSLVLRFRRSRGEERQQLKWFASATVLAAVLILSGPIFWSTALSKFYPATFGIAAISILTSIGVAMLKYRLYDIDLIINRTLVYGSLTGSLALLYLGAVIALQAGFRALTGQTSDVAIALSTLLIAALFTPWRRRLQGFIDRRFYRRKYDAARTLAAFQRQLRDEVDLEQLSADLVRVVQDTMQPAHVSLWLDPREKRV